jgi:hypothetical protein
MSAPARWPGHCPGCDREAEIETRYDLGARALCDDCTARATSARYNSPPSSPKVVPLHPDAWSLKPGSTDPDEGPEVDGLLGLAAAGEIEPVEVAFRQLPDDAPPVVRRVVEDFALVYGVRLWAGDRRPVAYGVEWVARRLGLPRTTVRRALRELVDGGILTFQGELEARDKGNGTKTYLPGGATR